MRGLKPLADYAADDAALLQPIQPRIKPGEIRALTGVRGVAAVWVAAYHLSDNVVVHDHLSQILMHGYLAVDLFFALSGFVMALTYGHLAESGWTRSSFATFLLRRIARIYPLYLLVTLVLILATAVGFSPHVPCDRFNYAALTNLVMVQSWGLCGSFDVPAWSISTEYAAYLLFPLLLLPLLDRGLVGTLALFLVAVLGMSTLAFVPVPHGYEMHSGPLNIWWNGTIWSLVRCLIEFFAGLAIWKLWQFDAIKRMFRPAAVAVLLVGATIVVLVFADSDVLFVVLCAGLILSLATGDNAVTRLFASPAMHVLGDLSYALYLLHYPMLKLLKAEPLIAGYAGRDLGHTFALLIYVVAVVALSYLAHRYVEVPARKQVRALQGGG